MKNLIFIIMMTCLVNQYSHAEEVKLKVLSGIVANANYAKGEATKPAILVLHGFLQSYNFSIISSLFDNISSEGYTVLSPSLSLKIPNRKKSLSCEALHDHSIEDDQKEIAQWVDWLKSRGHKKIVLIGHSQGSTSLLSYLTEHKRSKLIKKFIAVSVLEVNVSRNKYENNRFNKLLDKKLKENSRSPISHKLSFCNKYLGTIRSFKSYQKWTTERIITSIKELKIPVRIIMGGSDNRIRKNWVGRLKSTKKPLSIIKGANHFMDGFHEFDLLEVVLKELESN